MKHQRHKLSIVFFFALSLSGLQAQNMYVRQTNGTQTTQSIANIEKLIFSSGNLEVIKTTGINDSYALNEVRYLNYKDLTLGLTQPTQIAQKFFVYPNPVTDVLNLSFYDQAQPITSIEILSMEGRLIQQENLKTNNQLRQLNMSGLPQGLYLCKVASGSQTQTIKFLKQ